MRIRQAVSLISTVLAIAFVLFASPIQVQASVLYQVTVNTSVLNGTMGNLDFQFNPGNASSQAAQATINLFAGGTVNGTALTVGGVSGNLPSVVTVSNSAGFNDYFQGFTFGPSFSFLLQLSGPAVNTPNKTATAGSTFAVSLYNAAGDLPLLTTNSDGFIVSANVNLDGSVATVTYPSNGSGGAPVATLVTVPEPATFASFGAAFLLCAGFALRPRNTKFVQ